MSADRSASSGLDAASRRVTRAYGLLALVLLVAEVASGAILNVGVLQIALGAAIIAAVSGAGAFFFSAAVASREKKTAWIIASYPASIVLLIVFLYIPGALGVPVRFAGVWAIVTVVMAMIVQALVLVRSPLLAVDAPASEER